VREQVDELGRLGRLRRFLSPQLAEMIASSGDERLLESHRREITVVFCDLRGFTAFAESAEPEEVMIILREYHAALGELISQYEGTLERFAGDGIMVFFNDPMPCDDPPSRAVRMALAMRERVRELRARWRRRGYELGFGVGIAEGYATCGRIGFEGRYDYGAIGTVTNLAARLCGEAEDDQIVVSGRVYADVEAQVEAKEAGALTLKGLQRPVAAFHVLALR
jgi:adenylate cyclase